MGDDASQQNAAEGERSATIDLKAIAHQGRLRHLFARMEESAAELRRVAAEDLRALRHGEGTSTRPPADGQREL